jgi:two-component system LytT family response regulator
MFLTTVIVDDEPIARRVLREELENFGQIRIIGEAGSGAETLRLIETHRPHLVFLDLQLPGMSGFELVKQIGSKTYSPVFIIVTAFDRFAIQAFESGAVDYLMKPIREVRLAEAIEKACRVIAQPDGPTRHLVAIQDAASQIANNRESAKPVRRILAKSGSEYLLLATEEVFAFKAEGDVVWILTEKQRFLAMETLRSIQSKLQGTSFKRVHREVLVNIDHIRKVSPLSSQRWLLTLSNHLEFVVSKRQTKSVRDLWNW